MILKRLWRHVTTDVGTVRRLFPPRALAAIAAAVQATEGTHSGEVRVVIEASLPPGAVLAGQTARDRAIDVFSAERVWDTEENNGVLIYLLLADHDVEIVADRGIHARCGAEAWETVCRLMEASFRQGRFEAGAVAGVQAVGELLARHFPSSDGGGANELPDEPVVR